MARRWARRPVPPRRIIHRQTARRPVPPGGRRRRSCPAGGRGRRCRSAGGHAGQIRGGPAHRGRQAATRPPREGHRPARRAPLLQFCHPALALIGFGFWLAFVLVHYRPLAWISFGVLVVTLSAGLSWLTGNTLEARRHQGAAPAFPPRLIVLHGLAAAATLALTVLTALTAGHG